MTLDERITNIDNRGKMDLQTIVKETRQLTDNLVIAKFANGFDVAYEKQLENEFQVYEDVDSNVKERRPVGSRTIVKYSLLPAQRSGILSGNNCEEIHTNKPGRFSPQAHSSIDAYISERTSDIEDFDKTAEQLFEEFAAPLEIEEFNYRDWKEYGRTSLIVFGWPILAPYYLIAGRKHDHSGDGGLAILAAPLVLPQLVKELIAPGGEPFLRKAKKSKAIKGVLYTDNRGNDPAVVFHHDDDPKKFTQLEVIFPNGITLTDHGLFNYPNQPCVMERYHKAKFFFHLDVELNERVYDLNDRKQDVNIKEREFYQQLRKSDHEVFLKGIGFM